MKTRAKVTSGRTMVTVWDDEMGKPVRRAFVPAAVADRLLTVLAGLVRANDGRVSGAKAEPDWADAKLAVRHYGGDT